MEQQNNARTVMRVSAKSNVKAVAGSIIKYWEEGTEVELVTVGAASLNQASKAIAAASGILASKGYTLLVRIGFTTVNIEDNVRTAMRQALTIS